MNNKEKKNRESKLEGRKEKIKFNPKPTNNYDYTNKKRGR
jgi:hypothetical protein